MSFEYIKQAYGKKFQKGQIVLACGSLGVVEKATHHVFVRLSGEKRASPYHPGDVEPAKEMP